MGVAAFEPVIPVFRQLFEYSDMGRIAPVITHKTNG